MQHSHDALDRPGGIGRGQLLSPLRHRDFRVLWTGMTVSLVGDGIFLIAIAWESYALWNAPAALAIRPRVFAGARVHPSTRAALKEGLRFVRRRAWLWGTLVSAGIAYLVFLGPAEVLLPFVVKNDLHASAGTLGLVLAAGGVGAIG